MGRWLAVLMFQGLSVPTTFTVSYAASKHPVCAHLVHWEITSSASSDEPGALLATTSWPWGTPVKEN